MKKAIISVFVFFCAQTIINAQEINKIIVKGLPVKIEAYKETYTIEKIEIKNTGGIDYLITVEIFGEGLGMGSVKDGKLPINCLFVYKKMEHQTYMIRADKETNVYIFNVYRYNPIIPEPETIVFFPTDNPKNRIIVNYAEETVEPQTPPPPQRGRRGRQ